MKKKVAQKKTAPKKTVKRTAPRSSSQDQAVLFSRIVIITTCLVLAMVAVIIPNRHAVNQAVAGASIMNGLYDQATVAIPNVPNAVTYNVYYRQTGTQTFSNAVRNIPAYIHTYTISYLKKGTSYEYMYAAADKNGREFLFSEVKPLVDLQSM